MCQCSFINCDKCSTLVEDIDSGGGCACVGAGGIWAISISFIQFCCEIKPALKNKVFQKKKR